MRRALLLTGPLALAALAPAHASFLDDDFYCRVKGCVIVHDGFSFDVYDNHIFDTNGTVPPGGRMIRWSGNPFQGVGAVNPVVTGTRTEGVHVVFQSDQGFTLGIDQNGDGLVEFTTDANGDGVLDASDQIGAFNLTSATRLRTLETAIQRSFYLSSRTDFYVSAQVFLEGPASPLNTPQRLGNVVFDYAVTAGGVDDGLAFGADARANSYRRLGDFSSLEPLYGAPQFIAEFRNAIRRRNSDSQAAQSIRFDYVYGFENYDLSLGAGSLDYRIEFEFYNR